MKWLALALSGLAVGCLAELDTDEEALESGGAGGAGVEKFPNRHGVAGSFHTSGSIHFDNPFFVPQTSNGRTCASCHDPATGWTITPEGIEELFEEGDPLFNVLEMAVCPNGACPAASDLTSEDGRRRAFATALARATSTFPTTIPPVRDALGNVLPPEIIVDSVEDPFGYSTPARFSRFRRPLPTVNLPLISTSNWTGAASVAALPIPSRDRTALRNQLANTFNGATKFHGQSTVDVPVPLRLAVADFLLGLYSAQTNGNGVGSLTAQGGRGGPVALSTQDFYDRINDNFGRDPITGAFDNTSMDVYDAWTNASSPKRAAVARGQAIFNTRTFSIFGVGGINDTPIPTTALTQSLGIAGAVLPVIPPIPGVTACSTCHDSPNAGSRSAFGAVDIGVADCDRVDGATDPTLQIQLHLRNAATGATRCVTDIGRAQITGRWADIGKFKGPTLRALAARSHYFHDGSAPEIEDVINFYDLRFQIGLSAQEKKDLAAFLRTL